MFAQLSMWASRASSLIDRSPFDINTALFSVSSAPAANSIVQNENTVNWPQLHRSGPIRCRFDRPAEKSVVDFIELFHASTRLQHEGRIYRGARRYMALGLSEPYLKHEINLCVDMILIKI